MSRPTLRNNRLIGQKPGFFRMFPTRPRAGSGLASHPVGTFVTALCVALCSGCLVTDEITFDDELDLPPVILNKPGFEPKIGGIVWIKKGRLPMWDVDVQVRDENVGQELAAHWRIVHEDDMAPGFSSTELLGGDQPVRDLKFPVQTDDLRDGECHRLELAVSSSFFPFRTAPMYFDFVPEGREGDVAYAWWWIWEGDGEDSITDSEARTLVASCNAIESLLATTAVAAESP